MEIKPYQGNTGIVCTIINSTILNSKFNDADKALIDKYLTAKKNLVPVGGNYVHYLDEKAGNNIWFWFGRIDSVRNHKVSDNVVLGS